MLADDGVERTETVIIICVCCRIINIHVGQTRAKRKTRAAYNIIIHPAPRWLLVTVPTHIIIYNLPSHSVSRYIIIFVISYADGECEACSTLSGCTIIIIIVNIILFTTCV